MKPLIAFVILFFVFVGTSYSAPREGSLRDRLFGNACANGQCAVPQVAVAAPATLADWGGAPASVSVETTSACATQKRHRRFNLLPLFKHRR